MTPLLATLFSSGLSILGNAVLAKGKEIVEDKLGVSLEKSVASEEGVIKLKQLEVEHEQFLLNLAIKEKELDYADTANARDLGKELSKSNSFLNQNIMPILALITVVGSSLLLWFSDQNDVKMAAVSFITMVLGFFFGSSQGSKDKQEQLHKLRKTND